MTQNSAIYAVIPIAIVFIILKICLIAWRLYVRQQRRDAMHRTLLASRVTVQRPDRLLTGQMLLAGVPPSYFIAPVGYPSRSGLDPSLPPSYEQAITGEDCATTLEGECVSPRQPLLQHYVLPPHWVPLLDNGPHPSSSQEPLPPYTPATEPVNANGERSLLSPTQRNC